MKRGGGVSGAVSLVMIFCVLCLAVFAVLTLATADREAKLAEMTARSAADYYEADRRAVEIAAALQKGEEPADAAVVWSGNVASFTVPIGEDLALDAAVRVQAGSPCEIIRWRTIYTGEWEPEEYLNVWDGT